MKKAVAAVIASLYLVSLGALAADEHKCKPGEKYDTTKKECVKEKAGN